MNLSAWNLQMPVGSYKTYRSSSPLATHYRKATCEEVDCPAYMNGWSYKVSDLTGELVDAIKRSGKNWRRVKLTEEEDYLVFDSGQQCFDTHQVSLDRPAFYYVGRGHSSVFRTRNAFQHRRAEDWIDDFATHQNRIIEAIERG